MAGSGININRLGFGDRLTRGGSGAWSEGFSNFWSWLNTDNRRSLSVNLGNGAGRNGVGSWFRKHEATVTYRHITALTTMSGVRVNRALPDDQWTGLITDTANHYVFGRLDQTAVALTERLSHTMTPNLSLQLYAQPFVSEGACRAFQELSNARSRDSGLRYTPFACDLSAYGNPDFNVKSFRTTNALPWEYKAGSTLCCGVAAGAREQRAAGRLPRHLRRRAEKRLPRQDGVLGQITSRESEIEVFEVIE